MTQPAGTPRTRVDRTADSRALILDAAVHCLAEQGYAATTTLAIQARAGVSRGRLLHHFPSRDALLIAAAQHLAVTRMQETERLFTEILGALHGRERIVRATELLWEQFRQPYFWAAVEIWTAARTRGDLRETLRPEEQRLGAAVRTSIAVMYGPELAAHPQFGLVREILFTSMRGVAMTYTFDPRDPEADRHLSMWIALAETLLEVTPVEDER
ncbi:MAG: TetR/AcrR family transcriptional regulator [Sporichthyaceae bacterium]